VVWCIHNSILNVGPVYLATMWTVHCSSHISHQLRLDFEDTEVVRTLGEVKKTYHSSCSGWHSMIQWMNSTSQVAIPARFKLNKYQYKKTFSNQSKYHWMLASRLPAILGPDCVQPGWRTAQHGESTVEKKEFCQWLKANVTSVANEGFELHVSLFFIVRPAVHCPRCSWRINWLYRNIA
jgi:hypothetical protein